MTPTDWHHYDTFWRQALLDELTWSLTIPEFLTWLEADPPCTEHYDLNPRN